MDDPVQRLADLRQRVFDGEEISPEEYEEVLSAIRLHRRSAATVGKERKSSSSSKSSTSNLDTSALLNSLTTKANKS